MFFNADLSAGQGGLEGIIADFTLLKSAMIPSKNPIFYVSLATGKMLENLNYNVYCERDKKVIFKIDIVTFLQSPKKVTKKRSSKKTGNPTRKRFGIIP